MNFICKDGTPETGSHWDCAGCYAQLELLDISVIGPGTLKWCKPCASENKPIKLTEKLNVLFEEGTITVKVILQMTKDQSREEHTT